MRRRLAICAVIGATLAALAVWGIGALSASAQNKEGHVFICHRTNAPGNAYNFLRVKASAVDGVGKTDHFGEHKGPLVTSEAEAQALKNMNPPVKWGDIIPLVPPSKGLNWPAGKAILDKGCKFATPLPTTGSSSAGSLPTTGPLPTTGSLPTTEAPAVPPTPAARPPVAVAAWPRVTG